jgi:ABC-type transport system involved in Fe-S cluster assembly fused permease/ATPase subunit
MEPRLSWAPLRKLLAPLWTYRRRVLAAVALLVAGKLATVGVPLMLKSIVDVMGNPGALASLPVFLLAGYAFLRFTTALFAELRDAVFARVTQHTISGFALQVFGHLHQLSPRFHLSRQTGALSRDIERGTRGIGFVLSIALLNIVPTLVEITLVLGILLANYDLWFSLIILGTFVLYGSWTLVITDKRLVHRRAMNALDSRANNRAIDSLINYEAVKYFTNEAYEVQRFQRTMQRWANAAVRNQTALSVLHIGQSAIIALGVASVMLLAGEQVFRGGMTVGDLVLVNAYVIQICLPLNFLGFAYRELKDALTDMEKMFSLLEQKADVVDAPGSRPLKIVRGEVGFDKVSFGYVSRRPILHGVSFCIPPGHTIAVVGGSGAGKSTLPRLLLRFFDVDSGRVTIDGQDVREVTQQSLRAAIGIVPQDTVLFNDTIEANIAYGRLEATREQVENAARAARIHDFIESLPEGYATVVGERGLKLSGGEKQRIAIARAILKNPPILILDEATSALDMRSEKAIQSELDRVAKDRTTLIVAHRLSTIVNADEIIVLDRGRVAEQGTHDELIAHGGIYAQMWQVQRQERSLVDQGIEGESVRVAIASR